MVKKFSKTIDKMGEKWYIKDAPPRGIKIQKKRGKENG
jgi:hypothetical protein